MERREKGDIPERNGDIPETSVKLIKLFYRKVSIFR
jgi:hypothetical protein